MLHVFFATMMLVVAVAQVTVLQQWVAQQGLAGPQQASAGGEVSSRGRADN